MTKFDKVGFSTCDKSQTKLRRER